MELDKRSESQPEEKPTGHRPKQRPILTNKPTVLSLLREG